MDRVRVGVQAADFRQVVIGLGDFDRCCFRVISLIRISFWDLVRSSPCLEKKWDEKPLANCVVAHENALIVVSWNYRPRGVALIRTLISLDTILGWSTVVVHQTRSLP